MIFQRILLIALTAASVSAEIVNKVSSTISDVQYRLRTVSYYSLTNMIYISPLNNWQSRYLRTGPAKKVTEQKMARPCTLALVETQFEDRTEEHHWECEIDALDNDGIGGKFVELNLNFDVDYKDPDFGLLEPGVTTL